jgi:hypothetical protein
MEFLLVLAALIVVVLVVSAPLRREAVGPSRSRTTADVADLEAARDAKYREIRDAELDHRTGKLSDADYEAVDRNLRGEAIEILDALDRAHESTAATINGR